MNTLPPLSQPVPELPVSDVVRAQHYYRDIFGFDIAWLYPDKTVGAVSFGDVAIFFRRKEPPFQPSALWFYTENLTTMHDELKSRGADIVEPVETRPWGLRQFTVEDLDKNRFYFHHD